jgi:hypothetical protein
VLFSKGMIAVPVNLPASRYEKLVCCGSVGVLFSKGMFAVPVNLPGLMYKDLFVVMQPLWCCCCAALLGHVCSAGQPAGVKV